MEGDSSGKGSTKYCDDNLNFPAWCREKLKIHFLKLDLNQKPSDCQADALPIKLSRRDGIKALEIHITAVGSNPCFSYFL